MTTPKENTENELVSVIIPCFNHGQFLQESFQSIKAQTYKNLQIILVNDGSSDNTLEVMQEIVKENSDVLMVSYEQNMGKWYALNKGISIATGVFVTFQDADDISLPDRIDRQLSALKATEAVHVLCGFHHCHTQEEFDKLKTERVTSENLHGVQSEIVSQMVEHGFLTEGINHYFTGEFETAGVSAMFLKSLWDVGFRFNPPKMGLRVAMSEDSDLNTRLTLSLRNTVLLAEKLYLYRRWTGHRQEAH